MVAGLLFGKQPYKKRPFTTNSTEQLNHTKDEEILKVFVYEKVHSIWNKAYYEDH